jgi:hypothetical protein
MQCHRWNHLKILVAAGIANLSDLILISCFLLMYPPTMHLQPPATNPASGPAFPASCILSAEVVTLSDALRRLSIASMERAAERIPACLGLIFDTSPVSARAAATAGSLLLVTAWLCNSLMPVFCTDWKASASPQSSSSLSGRYDCQGYPP